MPSLNWGMIQDGGTFESLMHAILFAENPNTILFGRVGPDQGQDARSADGNVVYQAKFRQGLTMDVAIGLAKGVLDSVASRSPTLLFVPLLVLGIPVVNLLGWLLAKLLPADDFMPLGYRLVCTKIT